ncbi:MAG: ribonuclease P protein component [Eubacterium sp.]|nr:ribonuclease P protein component [Eubacterium sp.]
MRNSESLKKNNDFRKVYRTGRSHANKNLVMYVRRNDLARNRIGISVSKKVGNSVVRHHLTRLIRESYRLHEEQYRIGYDVVVVARVHARDCTYAEIERAMLQLAAKHHLLEDKRTG